MLGGAHEGVHDRDQIAREEELLSAQAAKAAHRAGTCPRRKISSGLAISDRDRILHCKSFRRPANKTQVFLAPEGDHYRTRLTHTLEVAQIARSISHALGLNEDLTEAIALGHGSGHTPAGHCGNAPSRAMARYRGSIQIKAARAATSSDTTGRA